ncbi:NUDIX hydrolase [Rubinisphaera sp.]|uniref:NUDIX hydrolase n=1 Tax=Rubinisphaera sp. TaxID=2024857 RepID=UPI0025EEB1C0|nr:NUDIX hydrolase [Rubinisphaera sp.]
MAHRAVPRLKLKLRTDMVSYHPPKHFEKKIPAGDDRTRLVCNQCEWVHYENPKIIVGLVPIYKDKILLCNRAIDPRQGYWTIPAGFMELKETAEAGAKREAWEEARVQVEINALLGVYSIPRAGQVHLIYRAIMDKPEFAAGPESHDVRLFAWEEIPWDNLAFLSNHWALNHYYESREWDSFAPFGVPSEDVEEVAGHST